MCTHYSTSLTSTLCCLSEMIANLSHYFIIMASSKKCVQWIEILPVFHLQSKKGEKHHSALQVMTFSCANAVIICTFGTEVIQN